LVLNPTSNLNEAIDFLNKEFKLSLKKDQIELVIPLIFDIAV